MNNAQTQEQNTVFANFFNLAWMEMMVSRAFYKNNIKNVFLKRRTTCNDSCHIMWTHLDAFEFDFLLV